MRTGIRIAWLLLCLLTLLLMTACSKEEEDTSWKTKPVFTEVYEVGENTLQLKWTGDSNTYKLFVDGKHLHLISGGNQFRLEKLSSGAHSISLIPVKYVSATENSAFSFDIPFLGEANWDWKAIGIDPKKIFDGEQSDLLEFNYTPSTLGKARPEIKTIETDFNDNVVISFKDPYAADGYRIFISHGKAGERHYDFDTHSEETSRYISKTNGTVSITLDKEYLDIAPELNEEYGFSVQLIQYPKNLITGEIVASSPQHSEISKKVDYTPEARWKIAPIITYHAQTDDGEITLRWEHDDNGLRCTYKVLRLVKYFGVKKEWEEIGQTDEHELVVGNLKKGKHNFVIVPTLSGEDGHASEEISEDIKDLLMPPLLTCSADGDNTVKLRWKADDNVQAYHITVYAGSSSVLQVLKRDYKMLTDFDVPVAEGEMEYYYQYDGTEDSENGVKLKFEIYGVSVASDGAQKRSATSSQTIVLR